MAYIPGYNPAAPVGERLAPEIRTEIALLVPTILPANSVGGEQLQEGAVGSEHIGEGAVTEGAYGAGSIHETSIAYQAVTSELIAPGSIHIEHVEAGVATTVDTNEQAVELRFTPLTATEYAAIPSPDPNTIYLVREG